MEKEVNLKPIQKDILEVVEKHDGLLSITEIARKLGKSVNTVFPNVISLEFRWKLIETRRIGNGRRVSLRQSISTEVSARLIERVKLHELEFRILIEVKDGESIQEAAEKLKALPMQIEARMRSILAKFEVETFAEAKRIFLKHKKELMAPLVV